MYALLRRLLFALEAERSHDLALAMLAGIARSAPLCRLLQAAIGRRVAARPVTVMGLRLANPVGLAAGLDKHGATIDAMAALGFGFIETGTVTPRPQSGNPRPRLFRLPAQHALINRMGFNSVGLDRFLDNLNRRRSAVPIGINLGKNAATPINRAADDYRLGMRRCYAVADYLTINISSPNTTDLRSLQHETALDTLLGAIKTEQTDLAEQHARYVPVALKIAPDLIVQDVRAIADLLVQHRFDGVIATNTSTARPNLDGVALAREAGGLSGAPLKAAADTVLHELATRLNNAVPIIGVGGITGAACAHDKFTAGASAVQLYTGLIYAGPRLVREAAGVYSGTAIRPHRSLDEPQ